MKLLESKNLPAIPFTSRLEPIFSISDSYVSQAFIIVISFFVVS